MSCIFSCFLKPKSSNKFKSVKGRAGTPMPSPSIASSDSTSLKSADSHIGRTTKHPTFQQYCASRPERRRLSASVSEREYNQYFADTRKDELASKAGSPKKAFEEINQQVLDAILHQVDRVPRASYVKRLSESVEEFKRKLDADPWSPSFEELLISLKSGELPKSERNNFFIKLLAVPQTASIESLMSEIQCYL